MFNIISDIGINVFISSDLIGQAWVKRKSLGLDITIVNMLPYYFSTKIAIVYNL